MNQPASTPADSVATAAGAPADNAAPNADKARRETTAGIAAARSGHWESARQHHAEAVRLCPDNGRHHWRLGLCESQMGREEMAGIHLLAASRLDPDFAMGHATLCNWFLQQGMVAEAAESSLAAVKLAPADPVALRMRAAVLEAEGEIEPAWQLTRTLVAQGHGHPAVATLYARMARWQGKAAEALALLERLLADPAFAADRYPMHLAAADLLDSLGRCDDAFAHAAAGNALAARPYDPAEHDRSFDRLIGYFTRDRMRTLAKAQHRTQRPIFIVGMPRSGTSLVEQVLAAHPAVHGGGELDFMFHLWQGTIAMLGAATSEYPNCLDRLTTEQADGLAQCYDEPLAGLCRESLRTTDKVPLNFLHLGLIALLLPEARVIHCQRDPHDTCLSCYMTAFRVGHDFKFHLAHLGRFYRQYARLMNHWHQVLDLPILDVKYEQLASDPEPVCRRIVEFAGLDWDERCLRSHQVRRGVTTSSVQQVRQPIYRSSVARWRKYERHLQPLIEALAG